ncbi:hypothetical protein [Paraburkholderia terrae]|uniref:hypothetical protein n=1 Tax=Paraburkholderia terrae TaxID=311230 RepID=UPI0012DFF600|nr:hypothetical protein [Paraburkholderia terrae]
MKSAKNGTRFLVLLATTIYGAAQASTFLCTPTESVVFSCSTERLKIIELCLDKRTHSVSYRYGRPERIELSYSGKQGGENGFFFNHYFRSNVDYTRISFVTAGYEYSVFRDYDSAEGPILRYGVTVSENGNEVVQIKCQSQIVDNMSKIIGQLRCDERSALGCS